MGLTAEVRGRFDASRACPKCGATRASTRWCGPRARTAGCVQERGEHLHRDCARCAFGWLEDPLDMTRSEAG